MKTPPPDAVAASFGALLEMSGPMAALTALVAALHDEVATLRGALPHRLPWLQAARARPRLGLLGLGLPPLRDGRLAPVEHAPSGGGTGPASSRHRSGDQLSILADGNVDTVSVGERFQHRRSPLHRVNLGPSVAGDEGRNLLSGSARPRLNTPPAPTDAVAALGALHELPAQIASVTGVVALRGDVTALPPSLLTTAAAADRLGVRIQTIPSVIERRRGTAACPQPLSWRPEISFAGSSDTATAAQLVDIVPSTRVAQTGDAFEAPAPAGAVTKAEAPPRGR